MDSSLLFHVVNITDPVKNKKGGNLYSRLCVVNEFFANNLLTHHNVKKVASFGLSLSPKK